MQMPTRRQNQKLIMQSSDIFIPIKQIISNGRWLSVNSGDNITIDLNQMVTEIKHHRHGKTNGIGNKKLISKSRRETVKSSKAKRTLPVNIPI